MLWVCEGGRRRTEMYISRRRFRSLAQSPARPTLGNKKQSRHEGKEGKWEGGGISGKLA